jgi:hypothetical protein
VIREAAKTFITEVLFMDWLQTQFIPRHEETRARRNHIRPVILAVDGQASHVTPRVVAFADLRQITIVKLGAYSSHASQPLDLCAFGVSETLSRPLGIL